MLSNLIFELLPDIEKNKNKAILRSSKILITMGETHREKITCTYIELRSSSTKKDKTKMKK